MAVIYRCDKCLREAPTETANGMAHVEVPGTGTNTRTVVDICALCRNRLIDWLKPDSDVRAA